MEDVVAAARRIEKILEEQTDSKMEHLVNTVQDQIQILKKDLKEANEQIAVHKAATPPAAAMASIPAPATATSAAAQPPPAAPGPPYLPGLQRGASILPLSMLSNGSSTLHVASSAEKKSTLCPTALPGRSSNAFFANKRVPAPTPHCEDKSWSCHLKRTNSHPNPNVQLNC